MNVTSRLVKLEKAETEKRRTRIILRFEGEGIDQQPLAEDETDGDAQVLTIRFV